MYQKQKVIKNDKLLKSLQGEPCILCGSRWGSAGHHHILRSKIRLDVPPNLSVLDVKCHVVYHSNPDQFIAQWGVKTYDYLRCLKDGYTIDQVYEEYA